MPVPYNKKYDSIYITYLSTQGFNLPSFSRFSFFFLPSNRDALPSGEV